MDDASREERELKAELQKQGFKDAQISSVSLIHVLHSYIQ